MKDNSLDQATMEAEFQQAQEAVKTGERCRVLMDIICETIGLTDNNTATFFTRLMEVQREYEQAALVLKEVVYQHMKREEAKASTEEE